MEARQHPDRDERPFGLLESPSAWIRGALVAASLAVFVSGLWSRPLPQRGYWVLQALAALGLQMIAWVWIWRRDQGVRGDAAALAIVAGAAVWLESLRPGGPWVLGVGLAVVVGALHLPIRGAAVVIAAAMAALLLADVSAAPRLSPPALAANGLVVLCAFLAGALTRMIGRNRRASTFRATQLQAREASARAAALEEGARLGRELQGVLAHSLPPMMEQLEAARQLLERLPAGAVAMRHVARAHHLAEEAVRQARAAVDALRVYDVPGPELITRLVEEFEETAGKPCRLTVEGHPNGLSPDKRLAIYRTAQEALGNVREREDTTSVDVELRYSDHGAELIVEDFRGDGAWWAGDFEVQADGDGEGGRALRMQRRAEDLGGTLQADLTATGFRVRLSLPG